MNIINKKNYGRRQTAEALELGAEVGDEELEGLDGGVDLLARRRQRGPGPSPPPGRTRGIERRVSVGSYSGGGRGSRENMVDGFVGWL